MACFFSGCDMGVSAEGNGRLFFDALCIGSFLGRPRGFFGEGTLLVESCSPFLDGCLESLPDESLEDDFDGVPSVPSFLSADGLLETSLFMIGNFRLRLGPIFCAGDKGLLNVAVD
jgi:hypothetical protein